MSEVDENKRVFSEQEVGEIMKRASALQEGAGTNSAYQPGVTREELARAAEEMGVDPQYLDQAIRERLTGKPKGFLSTLQEEERIVEGELDPQDYDVILENVRVRTRGRHGPVQIGRSLTAQALTGSGLARIKVSSRNGRTRVSVKSRPVLEVIATFYSAFLVTMMGGSALSESGHQPLAIALSAVAFILAFFACRVWLFKSQENASKLADKLQSIVAANVPAPPVVSAPPSVSTPEEMQIRLGQS